MAKRVIAWLILGLLLPGLALAEDKAGPEDFSFAVLGDTRPIAPADFVLSPGLKRMVEEINLIKPDLVFHTGDIIFGYGEPKEMMQEEYRRAMEFFSTLQAKIYYIPGNHDYSSSPAGAQEFLRITGQKKYFSFDYKGVHFIVLNTELPGEVAYIGGEQLQWLKKDLEQNQKARAIFVFMHRPVFPRLKQYAHTDMKKIPAGTAPAISQHVADLQNQDELARLFAHYRVSAVIAGHEHLFYKSTHQGVPYFIVGGGGAEFSVPPDQGGFLSYLLVEVSGPQVKTTVLEPYHFFVDYRYYQEGNKTAAEARLENTSYHKLTLDLKGLKFTLPKGQYSLKTDTIPAYELIKKSDPGYANLWFHNIEASIIKEAVNPQDPGKTDYYLRVKSPGGYTLSIRMVPK